jgi:hypothetical protein
MTKPKKPQKQVLPDVAPSQRQFSMPFESIELLGLTSTERMKVIAQLSRVLMLTAGLAPKERDDER